MVLKFFAGNIEVGPQVVELLCALLCPFTGLTVLKCLVEILQLGKDALRKKDKTSKHCVTSVWPSDQDPLWNQGAEVFHIFGVIWNAVFGRAPSYLKELIVPHHSNRSLCSESAGLPVVPRVSERWMGGRAFSYQSPFLWNQLPVWVQGAGTLSVFKVRLKTLLLDRQKQKEPAQSTLLSWPQSTVLL